MTHLNSDSDRELVNLRDIPEFASEAEEAAFWQTHELDDESLEKMRPASPTPTRAERASKKEVSDA